jgi:cellulose synthase/poly-beta-1,6-N-acetylglucosamine synthase-like glycosyltransferase
MWLLPTAIFWGSAALVGYTYAGYPLLIHALARLRPRPFGTAPITPRVSIVLAARDEQARIGAKLENLLALDYPPDRLQIIVVSDGSQDGTDEIVRGFAGRGVELLRLAEPAGKPAALNAGVARASGEIVLFVDARQRVDEGALRAVVAPFADPQVGGAIGELMMEGATGPGVYWRYEKLIRAAESRFDSVVTATGAFFAIRRHLYRELPADLLVDDLYTPMQIALQGFRVVLEPAAKIFDREADLQGEFARKARTLAGNFQVLAKLPAILDPRRNRLFVQYASHKVLRLLCPYALVGMYGASAVLTLTAAPGWPIYAAAFAGQTAAYLLALRGDAPDAGRLARVCRTFVVLNAAAVEGLRRFAAGELDWTTAR